MAQDQARGERLHELKNRLPGVTWRQIGDAIHVSERSVQAWAAGGGMEYKHAELLASFFRKKGLDVDADYIWRGPKTDTPDLLAITRPERTRRRSARGTSSRSPMTKTLSPELKPVSGRRHPTPINVTEAKVYRPASHQPGDVLVGVNSVRPRLWLGGG